MQKLGPYGFILTQPQETTALRKGQRYSLQDKVNLQINPSSRYSLDAKLQSFTDKSGSLSLYFANHMRNSEKRWKNCLK